MDKKTCSRCKESKPESEFYRVEGKLQATCKACDYQRVKEYRERRKGDTRTAPLLPGETRHTWKPGRQDKREYALMAKYEHANLSENAWLMLCEGKGA